MYSREPRHETDGWDDARLVDLYLRGKCGPFALALSARTGWPTVGIFTAEGGDWTDKPVHVGCRSPDGGYADARGTGLDEAAFTRGYGSAGGAPLEVRPYGAREIKSTYRMRSLGDHVLAERHVDRLLPRLQEETAAAGPFDGRTLDLDERDESGSTVDENIAEVLRRLGELPSL